MRTVQKGFTLIELTIVIVVLGVLAATAVVRYVNLNASAHKQNVAYVATSFRTAVYSVRAVAMAKSVPGARTNLPGFGQNNVDVNAARYPVDTSNSTTSAMNATKCLNVWNGILHPAPSISTPVTGTTEYRSQGAGAVCTYTYRRDTTTSRRFTYNVNTGVVTITANP